MTDNEIIKAFETCYKGYDELLDKVYDIINRQQAEIERLNTDIKTLENVIENSSLKKSGLDINIFKEIKSEAIKEFWNKYH